MAVKQYQKSLKTLKRSISPNISILKLVQRQDILKERGITSIWLILGCGVIVVGVLLAWYQLSIKSNAPLKQTTNSHEINKSIEESSSSSMATSEPQLIINRESDSIAKTDNKETRLTSKNAKLTTFVTPPPITHYSNYPTYTNFPAAIRARQIYEDAILNGNLTQENVKAFRNLPARHQGPLNLRGTMYSVEFDKSVIKHLMDKGLTELWSTPYEKLQETFSDKKSFNRYVITLKESNNRVYDFLHYSLGGNIEFGLDDFRLTTEGQLNALVATGDQNFIEKMLSIRGIISIRKFHPMSMQVQLEPNN